MPVSALVLSRSIFTPQKAALCVLRSCLQPSAYQVLYRRSGEPNWQFAGSVEAGAPLPALNLPELAPGEYEVEISAQGFAWNPHLFRTHMRFRIVESGAELAIPAVSDLQAVLEGGYFILSWLWKPQFGARSPSEFAVWISQAAAIDTLLPPTAAVPADGQRRYTTRLPGTNQQQFIAVAARDATARGHVQEISVPAVLSIPGQPTDQFVSDKVQTLT